jgi:hypothetical protein
LEWQDMNAAKVVMEARAAGIRFRVEGDDLLLEAALPPPPAVLEQLSCQKAAIVFWLRPGTDGWSAEDWHIFFGERAGIVEFDGKLPRPQAEAQAFESCIVEWLSRNPVRSSPERCLGCGGIENANDPLSPHGVESTGHAWLHGRCWPAWRAARRQSAIAALSTLGIRAPVITANSETGGAAAPLPGATPTIAPGMVPAEVAAIDPPAEFDDMPF